MMKADCSESKRFLESWDAPDFEWSPDSKWLTWSVSDNNFNSDVFVAPIDGSQTPLNISRHPDNDTGPVWSPDGKVIAFTGQRVGEERDIWFVYLQKSDDEIDERDRKMTEALEKLEKARKDKAGKAGEKPGDKPGEKPEEKKGDAPAADKPAGQEPKNDEPPADAKPEGVGDKEKKDEKKDKEEIPVVVVDADGINERIRRVSIPNTGESGLFWSPDSKKLAFNATIDGKSGTYTVEPPSDLTPKLLTAKTGRQSRWIKVGNLILWLAGGTPESVEAAGKVNSYPFRALSQVDIAAHRGAGFDLAWRAMRDGFYDGNLNNRNWDDIRRKYHDMAANAADADAFGDVVNMMLGELNGSHLGFYPGGRGGRGGAAEPTGGNAWNESTAHFGLRFDTKHAGPGLLVKDVIYNSPAWRMESRVEVGETVLAIDGTEVDPGMDLTTVLNGPPARDVVLKIKGTDDATREVTIRPITFGAARGLLYDHWVRGNQEKVRQASKDRFGYIHISGMSMGPFYDFERDLFAIAGGKEGLIIDVRENGGGSTADHLLTILTQPAHAITVPRGGGPGYPHDRMVYAPWSQPIVVLCNQNSFSNAEIFSHAIKTLKRGRLVGVPTAGGVISTGGTSIMDLGFLRMPFRGWYLVNDGEDMELNGAVPDFVIWPEPGDMMRGVDQQLDKAISALDEDVSAWKSRPQPELKKASERPGRR
jgi:tricorn protease